MEDDDCESESESDSSGGVGGAKREDLWYLKSTLVRDGLGSFLSTAKLREKVVQEAAKHGLADKCEPEALAALMDTHEYYMRGLVTRLI